MRRENDSRVIYRGRMGAELTISWWTCPGCGEDAELTEVGASGCAVPCPDCGDAMVLWWEGRAPALLRGRSAA